MSHEYKSMENCAPSVGPDAGVAADDDEEEDAEEVVIDDADDRVGASVVESDDVTARIERRDRLGAAASPRSVRNVWIASSILVAADDAEEDKLRELLARARVSR